MPEKMGSLDNYKTFTKSIFGGNETKSQTWKELGLHISVAKNDRWLAKCAMGYKQGYL